MTLAENKALVISFFKKANHDRKTPTEMCTKDFIAHIVGSSPLNLYGFQRYQSNYYASFSDTKTVIEDLIAEGDRVAFRGYVKSVHTAEFMGIPAKGKRVIVHIFGFAKIVNGKISEWWNSLDRLSWMQQIGALPELSKVKKSKSFLK
jgi:predicted ester cyclase